MWKGEEFCVNGFSKRRSRGFWRKKLRKTSMIVVWWVAFVFERENEERKKVRTKIGRDKNRRETVNPLSLAFLLHIYLCFLVPGLLLGGSSASLVSCKGRIKACGVRVQVVHWCTSLVGKILLLELAKYLLQAANKSINICSFKPHFAYICTSCNL